MQSQKVKKKTLVFKDPKQKQKKKRKGEQQLPEEGEQNANQPNLKLKLKELDKYQIQSTSIIQLSSSQKHFIDNLVKALQDRVLFIYDQSKKLSQGQNQSP